MDAMTHRDGFALPAALLALIIIGALVTGGVTTAMQQDRGSANTMHGNIAFLAAERGLQDVLGERTRPYFESIGVGSVDVIGPVAVDIDGIDAQYTIYVQRLNTRVFKIDAEGEVTGAGRYAGSKRRLAEMVRIAFTSVPMDRAITTQEPLEIKGQSGISGQDNVPAGWDDCSDLGLQKAVVAKDASAVKVVGAGGLTGNPEKAEDTSLDSVSFIQYGDMHLDDLKEMAEHTYPGGTTITNTAPATSGGECDQEATDNWGDPDDPTGACHYYWPIIYAEGDLSVASSSSGQGILIVDGDLHISGGFEFSGLVFVYGSFTASGSGNKVSGSVNVLGDNQLSEIGNSTGGGGTGNTQIMLSSCAIERAHQYNTRWARAIPLEQRRFVDLSGLGVE